mgnify:FL=1
MHPRVTSEALRSATADEMDLYEALVKIKTKHKALSSQKNELENKLRQAIGDDVGIEGVATWKGSKDRENFDKKAFREAEPDLYKKYITTSTGPRTLRIIGEKK